MKIYRTPSTPGTLLERFDESAIGRAVALAQLKRIVETYGEEQVSSWLDGLGLCVKLTRDPDAR